MGKKIPVDEGAEAFLELLNVNGVEYIFLNPGSDIFPIQEAVSKFKALGKRTPEVILCLHESIAMSAAHGYFMLSGRPQVVLVHVLGLRYAHRDGRSGPAGPVLERRRAPVPTVVRGRGPTGLIEVPARHPSTGRTAHRAAIVPPLAWQKGGEQRSRRGRCHGR